MLGEGIRESPVERNYNTWEYPSGKEFFLESFCWSWLRKLDFRFGVSRLIVV